MALRDQDGTATQLERSRDYEVGYRRPPVHSRFKPGQSGNPSGRPRGSQNLQTLFNKILKEEVSLREGQLVRKVSKAEAILRGLVIGAMKGDTRHVATLFRIAEQCGQFEEPRREIDQITRIIIDAPLNTGRQQLPAFREHNRD